MRGREGMSETAQAELESCIYCGVDMEAGIVCSGCGQSACCEGCLDRHGPRCDGEALP